MQMIKKHIISLFLVFSLILSFSENAWALYSKGVCLMDCDSGDIFAEKNLDTPMTCASLTKIMTLYIVFEKIGAGELSKDTPVPISQNAAKASRKIGISNIPLYSGETMSLDTLIGAMATPSACAACVAVAEHISGSEQEFVKLMNSTAARLGISASFADSSGLSDDNCITPRAVALLVRQFISNYPDILNYTKKDKITVRGKEYKCTNLLLNKTEKGYFYFGADGFKTGSTQKAGKCLVATAMRDGTRIISVTMGAQNDEQRYSDAISLLDKGFANVKYLTQNLFSTDIRAYIDSYEIPCYYYMGKNKSLCIIAENLNRYGFTTQYDSSAATLYIYKNNTGQISPLPKKEDNGMKPVFNIFNDHNLKVVLIDKGVQIPLKAAYSLNGQCAISFDEFGRYYLFSWDGATRCASMISQ